MTNQGPPEPPPAPRGRVRWGLVAGLLGGCACLSLGLVGILVAVALPDYLAFNCRSLQSEPKTHLTGLYRAELAFHEEHGFYSSDLEAVSWLPDGPPPRYLYGFAGPGPGRAGLSAAERANLPSDYDEERKDTANPAFASRVRALHMRNYKTDTPLSSASLPADALVAHDHFRAAAIGDDNIGKIDVWTIDDQDHLEHLEDGCSR